MTPEIKRLRKWMNLTGRDSTSLAAIMDLSPSHVRAIVAGRRESSDRFKRKFVAAFDTAFGKALSLVVFPDMRLTGLKTCLCCKESKPLADFHKDRGRSDGLMPICRKCNIAKARAWEKANPDRKRESNRQFRVANREHVDATKRAWREANPERARAIQQRRWIKDTEKVMARSAISNAVRVGKMPPADSHFCFICCACADEGAKMEYHHVDYSKPLEVIPLCRSCHTKIHLGTLEPKFGVVSTSVGLIRISIAAR